ncbi:MAG: sugar phosphate isomerase/epimerase family protein, partial [Chitinophagaceae bacterium]
MKKLTRRKFIGTSAKGLAGVWALAQLPQQLLAQLPASFNDIPIGFQTWPVRDMLAKDFAGTLKMMAGLGYKVTEMCSPKGYEKTGYGPLVSMKTGDMRKTITDAGLTCPSCHFNFGEFADDKLDASIEFSQQLGLNDMICSSFWIQDKATLDDYLVAADKLNKAAEKIKSAGMQAGFHNHSFEFLKLDGQLIYVALLNLFDAGLVKMQFQTEVINGGFRAADYFKKYPGRFISA